MTPKPQPARNWNEFNPCERSDPGMAGSSFMKRSLGLNWANIKLHSHCYAVYKAAGLALFQCATLGSKQCGKIQSSRRFAKDLRTRRREHRTRLSHFTSLIRS